MEDQEDKKPNMTVLGNNFYLVRTQAGLNKALKSYDPDSTQTFGAVRSYPAVVALSTGYNGGNFTQISAMHVSKMIDLIKDA